MSVHSTAYMIETILNIPSTMYPFVDLDDMTIRCVANIFEPKARTPASAPLSATKLFGMSEFRSQHPSAHTDRMFSVFASQHPQPMQKVNQMPLYTFYV